MHVTKGEKKLSKCEKYTQDHPSQPLLGGLLTCKALLPGTQGEKGYQL